MPACPGNDCGACCSAERVLHLDSTPINSDAKVGTGVLDVYNRSASPRLAPLVGSTLASGIYAWGWIGTKSNDFDRAVLWMTGGPDGASNTFHRELCVARSENQNADSLNAIHVFGPVLIPGRFVNIQLANCAAVQLQFDGEVWVGTAAQAAAWAGRAFGGNLGRVPAWHYGVLNTAFAAGATLRTPLLCIDPFFRLDDSSVRTALAGLANGVRAFSVDGNRLDFVCDITGGAAGSGITVRVRYGLMPASPLPFIGASHVLALGGVVRVDSDERTVLAPAAGVLFQPRAKGPWVQFELLNHTGTATGAVVNFLARVGRE